VNLRSAKDSSTWARSPSRPSPAPEVDVAPASYNLITAVNNVNIFRLT